MASLTFPFFYAYDRPKCSMESCVRDNKVDFTSVKALRKAINKIDRWRDGKNPTITVETTDPSKPFTRVKANDVWGKPGKYFMV